MTALVVYLQNTLARLRDREGQTMAEYALILGGIAILVIAGILILGPAVRDLFKRHGQLGPELPGLVTRTFDANGRRSRGRQEPPQDRRPLSIEDRDKVLSKARDLPMMRREFRRSEPCGIMWRTSRRGLAVRRLKFRREDGVAMTEFALILPIFMVIVAGLLGFGRVFFYWIQANHVANETARWAIVDRNPYAPPRCRRPPPGQFKRRVQTRIRLHQRDGAQQNLGDPLKVTVAKPFTFVPILGIGKITIRASSTMRVERLGGPTTP